MKKSFYIQKTNYNKKEISPTIYETKFRNVYLGGNTNDIVNAKDIYRIVKDKSYNRWLLLSELCR